MIFMVNFEIFFGKSETFAPLVKRVQYSTVFHLRSGDGEASHHTDRGRSRCARDGPPASVAREVVAGN